MSFPFAYTRHTATDDLTFFLSLMELFPRTMILHPVSASNCLAVSPRGPRILPTKLYCRQRERKPCESIYRHIKDRKIYIFFTSEKPFISNKQFPWAFKKHDLSFVGYHASATKTTCTAKTTLFQPFRSHFHTCTTALNFSRQQHWRICVWEHKSPYQSDRILNWPHPASSLFSVMSTLVKRVCVQVPSITRFLWSTRPCLTQNRFFPLVWHKQSAVC